MNFYLILSYDEYLLFRSLTVAALKYGAQTLTMKNPSSKKTDSYLQATDGNLKPILTKVQELEQLTQKILPYLEPNIAMYCQIANLIGSKLVIIVANGSVATQLRFQTTDLLRYFKQDPFLKNILEIQCKVRPPESAMGRRRTPRPLPKMQSLSPETATIVSDIAESLEDPKLRDVMRRIAKNVKG